nr:uncharacterized protein LOC105843405 [Hydra vulgaris]XP_047130911.1 uncharacterized protein LOC105843405 [Hydra vulgaris]
MGKCNITVNDEWVFLATSHGKSPCDGIGGTGKRVVCQESLKQITTGQILDVNLMYSFYKAKSGYAVGGVMGVYLAQNYEIPDVNAALTSLLNKVSSYEKSDPKKKE